MSDRRTAEWRQEVENDDAAVPKCKRCGGTGEVLGTLFNPYETIHGMEVHEAVKTRTCPSCGGLGVKTTRGREAKR